MKEEIKNKKMTDNMMDMVSGGSNRESESDMLMYARMTGKDKDSVVIDDVIDAYRNAKIKVELNTDGGNVYKNGLGKRISRYKALVLLARSVGKGDFDISGYLGDTESDNIINP